MGSLLIVDLIVFLIWFLKDPLKFSSEQTREGPITNDVKTVYRFQQCRSSHHMVWVGLLYSIKGLLIVAGIYLSYETRASKIETINDAHLVRMCTYNIFVSSTIDNENLEVNFWRCFFASDRLFDLGIVNFDHRTKPRRRFRFRIDRHHSLLFRFVRFDIFAEDSLDNSSTRPKFSVWKSQRNFGGELGFDTWSSRFRSTVEQRRRRETSQIDHRKRTTESIDRRTRSSCQRTDRETEATRQQHRHSRCSTFHFSQFDVELLQLEQSRRRFDHRF